MNILFLESDKYLPDEITDFIAALVKWRHHISVITDCYNNVELIKTELSENKPSAIVFMTTYVHTANFSALFSLSELIEGSVELWDLNGSYMGTSIACFIPDSHKEKFVVKQFNLLEATSNINGFLTNLSKHP